MLDYEFHPEAEKEADQEHDYYVFHGGNDLGSRYLDSLDDALTLCRTHPLHYRRFHEDVRRVILPKPFGEYYLPFVVHHEKIYILAVAHAKRKPYYWRKRLNDVQ
jgi:plasmid stabilization system protein ParE